MSQQKPDGYKIGQVGRMLNLPTSVLRYWEIEFEQLRPRKSDGGQRIYSEEDVQTVRLIKRLLYEEKFTISGARRELARLRKASDTAAEEPALDTALLASVKKGLLDILALLR